MAVTSRLWLTGFLLILVVSAATPQNMVIECTTPSGEFGSCIHLVTCVQLYRLLSSRDPANLELVQKSNCGFDGNIPKVCCPNESHGINFPKDRETATGSSRLSTVSTTTIAPQHLTTPPTPVAPPQSSLRTTSYEPPTTPHQPHPQRKTTTTPAMPHLPQTNRPDREPPPTPSQKGSASTSWEKKEEFTERQKMPEGGFGYPPSGTVGERRTTPSPINVHLPDHADTGSSQINGGAQETLYPSPANILPDSNNCGLINLDNKIYGGENTSIEDFPWMALLKYKVARGEQFGCAGVLINHRYVLTAAHCIRTPNSYKLSQVRLGEYNLDTEVDCEGSECNAPPLDLDVEEVLVHPEFDNKNLTNDIALIRLASDVNYTEWVQPICLPDNHDRDYTEQSFWVAGWGQTETGKNSPVKLKLEVRFLDLETCNVAYSRLNIMLGPGNMCAGGRLGRDTCAGDSGGPLMKVLSQDHKTNFHAVGIVSLGPSRCGLEGWAGVYTKVSYYANWIRSSLRP